MNRTLATGRMETLDFDDETISVIAPSNGLRHPLIAHGESFETACPVTLPVALPPTRLALADPEPAPCAGTIHDPQTERYLISLCLTYSDSVIGQCDSAGITPNSFFDRNCGVLFRHALGIWREHGQVDTAKLVESLRAAKKFEQVGGWFGLSDLTERVPTTINATSLINTVRNDSLRRALIDLSMKAAEDARASRDPAEVLKEQLARLQGLAHAPKAEAPTVRDPSSFALPPDNDSTILLGDRYLNRGDGAVLVGTSGIGKSSMEMQMAVTWALGRACFGIRPNGPMRSLIIQSEDSDGDIAEMWTSMSVTMRLSADEMALVNERVKIVNERVKRGREFTHELKTSINAHNPDLVWINPLQAFMDGDVTDSQDLGQFLRGDLNKLNVPPRFAYMVVHHTTKPATGKDRAERQWHEVMSDMAGGAEIINWARAILSLRAAPTEGEFNLVLAKRGRRAGVVKEVPHGAGMRLEPQTVIPLKHSTGRIAVQVVARGLPAIYWETRAPDVKLDPEEKKARGGRPVVYEFSDYKTVFPTKASNGLPISELKRALDANGEIDKRMLNTALKRWEAEGCIEVLRTVGHPMRYRCVF
jgi:hypothetical protein